MKNHFLGALKAFEMHVLFSVASFLFSRSFYWFISPNDQLVEWRVVMYSTITTFLFISAVYSVIWDLGRQDNIEGSKPYMMKGLVISLITSAPAIALYCLTFITGNEFVFAVYKFYQFTYWGYMVLGNGNALSCGLILLILPVVGTFAYIMGLKRVNITDKYISKLFFKNK